MKVTHSAQIEILACTPAKDIKSGEALKSKDGKPIYELAIKDKEIKLIGGQEYPVDTVTKLKSELELKAGKHTVELAQYAMSEAGSKRVELHYRVVALAKAA